MKKILLVFIVMLLSATGAHAWFVGFGTAQGVQKTVEEAVKQGKIVDTTASSAANSDPIAGTWVFQSTATIYSFDNDYIMDIDENGDYDPHSLGRQRWKEEQKLFKFVIERTGNAARVKIYDAQKSWRYLIGPQEYDLHNGNDAPSTGLENNPTADPLTWTALYNSGFGDWPSDLSLPLIYYNGTIDGNTITFYTHEGVTGTTAKNPTDNTRWTFNLVDGKLVGSITNVIPAAWCVYWDGGIETDANAIVMTKVGGGSDDGEDEEETVPTAPTGTTVSVGNGKLTISWTSVDDATSYVLYYTTFSGVTKTNSTVITGVTSPYNFSGLTYGVTYYISITAVNIIGESVIGSVVNGSPNPLAFDYFYLVTNGYASTDACLYDIAVDTREWICATGFYSYLSGNTFEMNALNTKYNLILSSRVWSRDFVASNAIYECGMGIDTDSLSKIYVTGYRTNGGSIDIFIVKYSTFGDLLWSQYYNTGGGRSDMGMKIAVDKNFNSYVAGRSALGTGDGSYVILKSSQNGTSIWMVIYSTTSGYDCMATDIGVDNSGNVYVTGIATNTSTGITKCITCKYNSSGNLVWAKQFAGLGNSLAVDSSGNIYVVGVTGSENIIIKYDTNGGVVWQKTGALVGGGDIAVDASNNIYVFGSNNSVIKYNSAGTAVWQKTIPYSAYLEANYTSISYYCLDVNKYGSGFFVNVGGVAKKTTPSPGYYWYIVGVVY
ncbi:MAG: hypothetical protein A2252_00275 [Elusimicrobia bacterium RIFOXYA2_FULL_39_19]|nr:MAG: hypothetical protein A2252_00275 [Elusimicrobia bacterium RIFOXYA2_FULL_39_19]